jgi:hypothetical protein
MYRLNQVLSTLCYRSLFLRFSVAKLLAYCFCAEKVIANDKCMMLTPEKRGVDQWLSVGFWSAGFSLSITVILAQ